MIWKALIRTAVVSLSILLCGSLAEANLCNARSWQTATGPSVQADIQAGQDPTQPCPVSPEGDYPLHLAAVLANDAGAVQALIDAGAGTLTPNGAGETPIALFTARYEQAVLTYGQAGPALSAISRILDLQFEALNDAQNSLCSLSWWQNPVNPEADVAVKSPGVDLDARCDSDGNTPLLVALSLDHIGEHQYAAITWLIHAGARNI